MAKKIRILVVDDEPAVRDSMSDWLREDGYEVGAAASGFEAVEKVKEQDWNIMLLDLKMPGMDGIETMKQVKKYFSGNRNHHGDRLRHRGYRRGSHAAGGLTITWSSRWSRKS